MICFSQAILGRNYTSLFLFRSFYSSQISILLLLVCRMLDDLFLNVVSLDDRFVVKVCVLSFLMTLLTYVI